VDVYHTGIGAARNFVAVARQFLLELGDALSVVVADDYNHAQKMEGMMFSCRRLHKPAELTRFH